MYIHIYIYIYTYIYTYICTYIYTYKYTFASHDVLSCDCAQNHFSFQCSTQNHFSFQCSTKNNLAFIRTLQQLSIQIGKETELLFSEQLLV